MQPQRITTGESNDQLLYFTSSSLRADDRLLVFISDRTGNPNLFAKDLQSGVERQLTCNEEGYLKSYVYFDGNEYKGIGKASVCLHSQSGKVYYIQGRYLCCVDSHSGCSHIIAELPDGQVTAFTHVSSDGTRICVVKPDGTEMVEISLPEEFSRYGHFTVSNTGMLVSDGYCRAEGDAGEYGEWISVQNVDWDSGTIE